MKRMVMVVAVLLISATMSLVQAQCEGKVPFMVNLEQLSSYLNLTAYQETNVASINALFVEKQKEFSGDDNIQQESEMQKLVYDNLKSMKKVLEEGQYRKYVTLVNVTNNNNRIWGSVAISGVYMVDIK